MRTMMYASTLAATIKQYLIVAREAAWGLGFEFNVQPETKV